VPATSQTTVTAPLAFLFVPLSVLMLGLGAIILNALFVFLLLDLLPGSGSKGPGPLWRWSSVW
jgi:hypothetical protein